LQEWRRRRAAANAWPSREAAVGVLRETGQGVAELLQEREDELQPAEEVVALLALRALKVGVGAGRVNLDQR
jgi:hypothetical protein